MDRELMETMIERDGRSKQIDQFHEEIGELMVCINHYRRDKSDKYQLAQEIADVKIMLDQLIVIFNLKEEDIDAIIKYKLNRLKKRLEGGKE